MKELETHEAKHHLEKTREREKCFPALEESDVNTDDDNLLPDCTDNELGGEGCDQDFLWTIQCLPNLNSMKDLMRMRPLKMCCRLERKLCLKRKHRKMTLVAVQMGRVGI